MTARCKGVLPSASGVFSVRLMGWGPGMVKEERGGGERKGWGVQNKPYPFPSKKSTMCSEVRSSLSMAQWRAVLFPGVFGRGAFRSTPSAYT